MLQNVAIILIWVRRWRQSTHEDKICYNLHSNFSSAHKEENNMWYAERTVRRQEQPILIIHSQCNTKGAPPKFCIWLQRNSLNFISGPHRIWVGARWLNHLHWWSMSLWINAVLSFLSFEISEMYFGAHGRSIILKQKAHSIWWWWKLRRLMQ